MLINYFLGCLSADILNYYSEAISSLNRKPKNDNKTTMERIYRRKTWTLVRNVKNKHQKRKYSMHRGTLSNKG
jgi:hypothetical protein